MTYLQHLNNLRATFQDPRTKQLPHLNEIQVAQWLKAMSRYSLQGVANLVEDAPTLWKWFPTIQEFVEVMDGDKEAMALEAWAEVLKACRRAGAYRGVEFRDPAMAEALRVAVGTWPAMCRLETDSYEFGAARKTFLEMYARYAPQNGPAVVMGGLGSGSTPYVVPRLDSAPESLPVLPQRVDSETLPPPSREEAKQILATVMARVKGMA